MKAPICLASTLGSAIKSAASSIALAHGFLSAFLDQRLNGGVFVIEATDDQGAELLGPLFSPPNYLSFGGLTAGPGISFGSARITFGPTPARHASMSVFGGEEPNVLTLMALRSGTQVGSSTIHFPELGFDSRQTLSISNVVFDELRLVASGPEHEGILAIGLDNVRITPIPEPGTLALLGAGMLGLLVRMRGG